MNLKNLINLLLIRMLPIMVIILVAITIFKYIIISAITITNNITIIIT